MEEEHLTNDENVHNRSTNAKENGGSHLSNVQSCNKNPLKPLNDASRLSGNSKDLIQEKTPQSSPFFHIRQLDSAERWVERNSVVIKEDHLDNVKNAGNILKDVVNLLPIDDSENEWISKAAEEASSIVNNDANRSCDASDIDELSDLMGGLDISPSLTSNVNSHTGRLLSNDTPKRINSNDASPNIETNKYVDNLDDSDDEIQFGRLIPRPHETDAHEHSESSLKVESSGMKEDIEINVQSESSESMIIEASNEPNELRDLTAQDVESQQREHNCTTNELNTADDEKCLENAEDPFQTKGKIANSPIARSDGVLSRPGIDSSNNQLKNDSSCQQDVDCIKIESTPDLIETEEIQSHVKAVSNSPFKDLDQIEVKPTMELNESEIADPFTTKGMIANSPVKNLNQTEIVSFDDIAGQDEAAMDHDLEISKTTVKIDDSPVKESNSSVKDFDNDDPFSTNTKIANSPVKESSNFESEKEAPQFDGDGIGSKASNQSANSPVKNEEENLWNIRSPLIDSPGKRKVILESIETEPKISDGVMADRFDIDFVEALDSIGKDSEEKPCDLSKNLSECQIQQNRPKMEQKLPKAALKLNETDTTPTKQFGALNFSEQKKDDDVKPADNLDDSSDFEDAMFVDAAEAFEPSALQEKLNRDFGPVQNQNLTRGSVLLKFDPLADERESLLLKMASPKQQRPTRVSEIFKGSTRLTNEDDVCLFGTPPKKVPRRPGVSRPPKIAAEFIEEETPANQVDMILDLEPHEASKGPLENEFSSANCHLVDLGAIYTEADFKKLKMDLTLHYEELMLKKDKAFEEKLKEKEEEHSKKLAEMEFDQKELVEEKEQMSKKSESFKTKLLQTKQLFDDFGKLISKLTDENKILESKLVFMKQDNTQIHEDYKKMDKSFDDLFHRYEKMKKHLEQNVENEAVLKKSLQESHEKFKQKAEAMKKMKEMAETKLTEQEDQIKKLESNQKAESASLEVQQKRKEMEIQSLKNALEQKKSENKELTEMCDSLISKVSGR